MIVIALPLLYALYAGILYGAQPHILFPASAERRHAIEGDIPAGGELVEVPVSYGKARAIYWAPRIADGKAPAVWFAHGNYETVRDSFALIQPLLAHGFAVLQLEYPGYGGADGAPRFDAINEAADATWNWLSARAQVDAKRMVAVGYSIGGGPAAELTRHHDVHALVLLSTYSSMKDIAHRYALPAFVVRYPYDNVARVRAFKGPVFVEHGRRDEVIPFELGQRLADARPDVTWFPQDCRHADCAFDRSVFAGRLPEWLAAAENAAGAGKKSAGE